MLQSRSKHSKKILKARQSKYKMFFGLEVKSVLRGHVGTLIIYLRTFMSQPELPSYKNKTGFSQKNTKKFKCR